MSPKIFVRPAATIMPSSEILDLVRDEACLSWCRETLQGEIERLARKKRETASTRSPFGILAPRETRKTFSRAMAEIKNHELVLEEQMTTVNTIRDRLEGRLSVAIDEFLDRESADYSRCGEMLAAIDIWESLLPPYFEQLWVFARDLGSVSRSIEESIRNPTEDGDDRDRMFARLLGSAQQMDRTVAALEAAAKKAAIAVGSISPVRKLSIPAAQEAEASIKALADLATAALPEKLRAMEARARDLITDDINRLRQDAAAAREDVRSAAVGCRDAFWEELRHQAQRYFGQERDLDEVLKGLADRHAGVATASRPEAVACGAGR